MVVSKEERRFGWIGMSPESVESRKKGIALESRTFCSYHNFFRMTTLYSTQNDATKRVRLFSPQKRAREMLHVGSSHGSGLLHVSVSFFFDRALERIRTIRLPIDTKGFIKFDCEPVEKPS